MDDTARVIDPWLVPGTVSIRVDASASAVYRLVCDVLRIGEWSREFWSAVWLDERRGPGARFRGNNGSGPNQ